MTGSAINALFALVLAASAARAQATLDTDVARQLAADASRLIEHPGPGVAISAARLLDSAAALSRSAAVYFRNARIGADIADSAFVYASRTRTCTGAIEASGVLLRALAWMPAGGFDTPTLVQLTRRERRLSDSLPVLRQRLCRFGLGARRPEVIEALMWTRSGLVTTPDSNPVPVLAPRLLLGPLRLTVAARSYVDAPGFGGGFLIKGDQQELLAIMSPNDSTGALGALNSTAIADTMFIAGTSVVACLGKEFHAGLAVVMLTRPGTLAWKANVRGKPVSECAKALAATREP